MKINKIMLIGLMMAMPFSHVVLSRDIDISHNKKSTTSDDIVVKAALYTLLSPIFALKLGCERRSVATMAQAVRDGITSEQRETWKRLYDDKKFDTKPWTTATGFIAAVGAVGALTGIVATAPASGALGGFFLCSSCLINLGILTHARTMQSANNSYYRFALEAVNRDRAAKGQDAVDNGESALSWLQRLYCINSRVLNS